MQNDSQKPRIYTAATAHLDTIWNWDLETTIGKYLYNTLADNFKLFEEFPEYEFNFEGAYRYELMEEYYPDLFEKLRHYVAAGRWHVTGSSYENGDVNIPSPEALFRNILLGNGYFKKTFGKTSKDIYLPDCFGFGWALPSIASHANLLGFTTQKLTWGSAYGTPFDLGKWVGVNGKFIFASINPDSYVKVLTAVRESPYLLPKLRDNRVKYGLPWTFGFHGTGDRGGAPKYKSVKTVCEEVRANPKSEIEVRSAAADQVFRDLAALPKERQEKLPRWENELVMTNHAVGGYTSRAIGKRWNRRNEELADLAERSAVAGTWLGGMAYPQNELDTAWKRVIAHQFHDDMPGTSVQRGYQRSWNDYVLSMNQFSSEYTHGVSTVARGLNTSWAKGIPVVVNNGIETERTQAVPLTVTVPGAKAVQVYNKKGKEIPSQIVARRGDQFDLLLLATVPSMGYAVYDVRGSNEPCALQSALTATTSVIENERYLVSLNENGDITSILDKNAGNRELLSAPIVLELHSYDGSKDWPAWEMDYPEVMAQPREYPVKTAIRVLHSGAVQAAIEVRQETGRSTFTHVISLDAGGAFIQVHTEFLWQDRRTLLKTRFPLAVSNETASFDLGLGVIRRGNAAPNLYEVPAQKWADISETTGEYGVSILSDCKYGWDKTDDHTLRLSVVHTPRFNYRNDSMQSMMELGLNRYGFAVYGHPGECGGDTQLMARCFSQPMTAFLTKKHKGVLGDTWSFGGLNQPGVILRAVKKAQESEEIIVRVNEGEGKKAEAVELTLGAGIESAREVYASEEDIGPAVVKNGKLLFDLEPYDVKSFALTLKAPKRTLSQLQQETVELPCNRDVISTHHNRADGALPNLGEALPGELVPETVRSAGVTYLMGDKREGAMNALAPLGQRLDLPQGYDTLCLLMASTNGDKTVEFYVDGKPVKRQVQDCAKRIGRWDLYGACETAEIKRQPVSWVCTHTHSEKGDHIAKLTYFYTVTLPLGEATAYVKLPVDADLVILAATAVQCGDEAAPAHALYDEVEPRTFDYKMTSAERKDWKESKKRVHLREHSVIKTPHYLNR